MRVATWVVVGAVLAGCAAVDRAEMSTFEPLGDGRFRFKARADSLVYRIDSPEAEVERLRWLSLYLTDNNLCPRGFEVLTRSVVAVNAGLAMVHDVYYDLRCKN